MNILLLMPDFFDYPKMIIEELQSRGYNVDFICNESDEFRSCFSYKKKIIRRVFRKLFPKYMYKKDIIRAEKVADKFYAAKVSQLRDNYDYVICIKGDMFPETQYSSLRNKYPNAKFIIYQWDDLSLLIKTKQSQWFDRHYSYNIEDCKKNNFRYLPMFSKKVKKEDNVTKKYDIAIIGTIDRAHKKRLQIIEKIYDKYCNQYSFFLYLYRRDNITTHLPSFTDKLPFDGYVNALLESKSVLDIALINQEGPTTRFNDALGTDTKVITTNQNIKKYPIFSDNILIIDEDNPTIENDFISSPYHHTDLDFMSVEKWCDTILS